MQLYADWPLPFVCNGRLFVQPTAPHPFPPLPCNQYTLNDLVSLCEGFLQGVLDEENAAHLYHYADALGMPTFEHRVLTFILRNWGKVAR